MGVAYGVNPTWGVQTNAGRTHIATKGIVQSGLVLNLDAGVLSSYPGTGTAWTDLSGNGNNGTLTNMEVPGDYTSTNGGILTFDGYDEFVDCGNATNLQITVGTISAWIKANNGNSGYNGIIVKQFAWGLFVQDNQLIAYDFGNGASRFTGITVGQEFTTWYYVVMTFTETVGTPSNNAIIYVNGTSVLTTTAKHSAQSQPVIIGSGASSGVQAFGGNISQVSIYNRALTAAEIQQNYLATKSRYFS
tara:strand:+ start:789 stop:1529 length:741 start_codon:yes stop_codon:yes gene_type:complete